MNTKSLSVPLALAGFAAVGVHAVDDSFLQPQPGTDALDHVVRGLVPLMLLGLSAYAYPRVRPGARATLTLIWAFMALLSGSEALYYAQHGGLSGDDYTGLLALGVAPVLLAVAGGELWSSRRRDRPARRYPRRALKTVAAVLLVGLLAFPVVVPYVGAHVARTEVPTFPVPHEDAVLKTADGLTLRGWYVPSRNGAAVIVYPGRKGPLGRAMMLARHGYGVLLYDRRGEGQSDGDPDAFGWNFDRDIRAGIAFLKQRPDVDDGKIAGIGLSVGGEMMLETASETKDLAAVVAEGAGARTAGEEVDDVHGGPVTKLLTRFAYTVRDATNAVMQGRMPPANLKELVPKIAPRAVFFIHAGARDVGTLGPEYYAVARQPKRIWEAAGGHTQAFAKQPREYERRVTEFLDESLGVKAAPSTRAPRAD